MSIAICAGVLGATTAPAAADKAGLVPAPAAQYPPEVVCPRAREGTRDPASGLEIPAAAGTAVLAIANGIVLRPGDDGRVVLRHTPGDTAIDAVVFSTYAPLRARSGLRAGSPIRRGEGIGRLLAAENGESLLRFATYSAAPLEAQRPPDELPARARAVHPLLVLSGRLGSRPRHAPALTVPIPYHVPFDRHLSDRNDGAFVWPLACGALPD